MKVLEAAGVLSLTLPEEIGAVPPEAMTAEE
jgi:hypothetical protein